jgi:hypothetical protein
LAGASVHEHLTPVTVFSTSASVCVHELDVRGRDHGNVLSRLGNGFALVGDSTMLLLLEIHQEKIFSSAV